MRKLPPKEVKAEALAVCNAADKEKREHIKLAGGAVGLRMGELRGEDVWHVKVRPYIGKHIILIGKLPQGARLIKGPGSGYKTAFYYGTLPKQSVKFDIGFQDVVLTPSGSRVRAFFTRDVNISRRSPGISGRSSLRITPKVPRLR